MMELSGELGPYWVKSAREEINKMQDRADRGEILTEEDGAVKWKRSGNYLPEDCVEKLSYTHFTFSPEATKKKRDAQTERSLKAYRESRKNHSYSAEELYEMRAAFGAGETVVDVITGQRVTL
jgi:hypothetical protein